MTTVCGNVFKLRDSFVCTEPVGHTGKHGCECPNPQFHQHWDNENGEWPLNDRERQRLLCRIEEVERDLASQINCTAQLESNIRFLNERLERAGHSEFHDYLPINNSKEPIGELEVQAHVRSMADRDKIARELANKLGIETSFSGSWFQRVSVDAMTGRTRCEFISDRARDALIDAHCRIAELEGDDWVRVEDGLPEMDGTDYLVNYRKFRPSAEELPEEITVWAAQSQGAWYNFLKFSGQSGITHWRRLPAPPVAEEKSNG